MHMNPKVGEVAPLFVGKSERGETIRLADMRGKKVVLYFYPKDNTPGCTAQACDLRDHYEALLAQGYVVLGVSTDSAETHKKFIEKHALPFSLLADTDKKIHEAYGVWAEKSMYGRTYMGTQRTTFVIDEAGRIEAVIDKVKTKTHVAQILPA